MKGSNLGLLHCRQILYQLSHQGRLYMCVSFICVFRVHQLHLVLAICLFWLKKKITLLSFCIPPIKKCKFSLKYTFGQVRKVWEQQISTHTQKSIKIFSLDFPGGLVAKYPPCIAVDTSSIPDPRRSHMPHASG